ncbi:MAG: ATP-binding cassette domain-containing protein [Hyphomicrobiales bacterium]
MAKKADKADVSMEAKGTPTIRLANISKAFSGVLALREVSVEFHPGEVHAILGENGAGKSTLMNIISGTLQPTLGEIFFEGQRVAEMTPDVSANLGIAISFQHPAILEDLSVLENLRVALPDRAFAGRPAQVVAQEMLDAVGLTVPLRTRADALSVAEKHLLEIAKALAIRPKVLILDEPTAPLDQDATDMLFGRIRDVVKKGTSVIYITHRLAEIRQIAQRVTVLRDGKWRGTSLVADISDADLVSLIVGRTLGTAFPPKPTEAAGEPILSVKGLSGKGFKDISFDCARGQIIGVAGVAGNGQSELMKGLAGLQATHGTIVLNGQTLSHADALKMAAFMPSDRHVEGLAAGLTVRENATFAALGKFARFGIMSWKKEFRQVSSTFGSLAVKAPGMEAPILSLSGGNQQKVVMSRALLSEPGLIIADEPTQGVDVGARAEIYRILREVSNAGTPVIVNSSDAAELEGLCDKVIVMSRGRLAETLDGEDVTEPKIVAAAVSASHHGEGGLQGKTGQGWWRHFAQSDNAPTVPLLFVITALALYVNGRNENFLDPGNIADMLTLAAQIGFIALGQTIAMLMAGIDLSVGPLAGFLVVVASFYINDDQSAGTLTMGFVLMFLSAAAVGLLNGILIRFGNFTAIAATMAVYMGLQGASFLLRESPDGYINSTVSDWITWKIGAFPVAFLALAAFAVIGEYTLRKLRPGWQHRAIGSSEESARRIGIRINRKFVLGYVLCSLFTACGAILLMAEWGTGDPRQGAPLTLSSITAVVLGGTSLRGGRGTFIGTVLGAVLLSEVLKAVVFLDLTQTYQYVFQGALIVAAALIYSLARGRSAQG